LSVECARCGKTIECNPSGDCWCAHLPGERIPNFGGCLCERCLTEYEDYANRFETIQRTLVKHFEDMGYEPDEEYDTTWRVGVEGVEFNITEMSIELNEALGMPRSRRPQPKIDE